MSRRLIAYVHVDGVAYGPDSQVPADVAKRIGDHAWTDGAEPAEAPADESGGSDVEAPPRSGRGSGIDAWRAFAQQHDVEFAADANREDIIAACEAAGIVEREE
ncbi:hypothetical protein ACIQPP_05580 [Streptomyces violaceusniger]|uniref:hypothetical protein n=1 Tax=Streptomyces violaceusniger TaxID=68280 RepID=UPI000997618D|nr:hypothetical protein [Streptomyces hygroscopicus]AQW55291.1 hypothetical protein SHXM_08754 [Streptomyces hygroscopicus]